MSKIYDLVIIGGSAAGAAAGVYAARRRLNFIIAAKDFGGEVATSGEIENYLGFPHTNGVELSQKFLEHVKANGVEPVLGCAIEEVKKMDDHFGVVVSTGCSPTMAQDKLAELKGAGHEIIFETKTVIITTGVRPRELNIPGEKEFRSKGLSYCTVCDGPLFPGKIVAVIGGGNSALESAIMMSSIAKQVYVVNKNPEFKGDAVLIEKVKSAPNVKVIFNAITQKILGEKMVTGVEYLDGTSNKTETLAVEGVFVHIGMVPNSGFLKEVKKNGFGEIIVNERGETNIPGLYAAGDVTNVPYKQISIAVGQGTIAALSVVDYLNKIR